MSSANSRNRGETRGHKVKRFWPLMRGYMMHGERYKETWGHYVDSFNQSPDKEWTSYVELFFHCSFNPLGNGTWRDSQMACRFCTVLMTRNSTDSKSKKSIPN